MTIDESKPPLRTRILRRIQRWITTKENTGGDCYTTLHRRPARAAQIGTWPEPGLTPPRAAVVMQGPPYMQDDFTLETLRLYSRNMPGCNLILSTWDDTDPKFIAAAQDIGVTVVLNCKPDVPGPVNVNMQLVTAGAGVKRAVADGAEWILKTRTDQRLYDPNVLPFLVALAQTFPIQVETTQRYRIVGVGHGSLKYAPYHVTDQTVFGHAEDMLAYWSPPLRASLALTDASMDRQAFYISASIEENCRLCAAESYIASQFLQLMGRKLDWTLTDSWAAYRDHFVFADYRTTDFFWVKSQLYTQSETNLVYAGVSNRHEMAFSDWLLLHSGKLHPGDAAKHEGVLNQPFRMMVPPP